MWTKTKTKIAAWLFHRLPHKVYNRLPFGARQWIVTNGVSGSLKSHSGIMFIDEKASPVTVDQWKALLERLECRPTVFIQTSCHSVHFTENYPKEERKNDK